MCWGNNTFGDLGYGAPSESLVPLAVSGMSNITSIDNSRGRTCTLSGGTPACWPSFTALASLGSSVVQISAGDQNGFENTCVLLSGGTVKCWGQNEWGQLGDGTLTYQSSPVTVTGLTGIPVAVAAMGMSTCVLLSTGSVKCWGSNFYGQLGDGTTVDSRNPVDATDAP